MKKLVAIILLLVVLMVLLVSCTSEPANKEASEEENIGQEAEEVSDNNLPDEPEKEQPPTVEDSRKIVLGQPIAMGDYEITVQNFNLIQDWEGNPLLKITYDWKNNSEDEHMATLVFSFTSYQDGIESELAMKMADDLDLGIGQRNVRSGYGQEGVEDAVLIDPEKPVEIELSEIFSWDDDKWVIELQPGDY